MLIVEKPIMLSKQKIIYKNIWAPHNIWSIISARSCKTLYPKALPNILPRPEKGNKKYPEGPLNKTNQPKQ